MLVKLYGTSGDPTVKTHYHKNVHAQETHLRERVALTVVGFGDTEPTPDLASSEPISARSGRFYMLGVLDEFADRFCCSVGEGYFHVDYTDRNGGSNGISIMTTVVDSSIAEGVLGSAARRVHAAGVCVDRGHFEIGADPDRLLLVALKNAKYEALMLYEIRLFIGLNIHDSSRVSVVGSGAIVYRKTFTVS